MYIRITPYHLSVSMIEVSKRLIGEIDVAEFSFYVTTAFGNEYHFLYQLDERGIPGWHMYFAGEGRENLATKAINRASLGRLNVLYTDKELDALVRRVNENPLLTTYLVVPGYKDAINRPDFIVFPMNKKTVSFLQTFNSASNHFVDSSIADTMSQVLTDARQFHLTGENKADFLNNIESELGIVNTNLHMKGYHMFSTHTTPPFILESIKNGSVNTETLRFEKNKQSHKLQVDGMILDKDGMSVGVIKNVQHALHAFEDQAKQFLKIQQIQNTQQSYRSRMRSDIEQGNAMGENIFSVIEERLKK